MLAQPSSDKERQSPLPLQCSSIAQIEPILREAQSLAAMRLCAISPHRSKMIIGRNRVVICEIARVDEQRRLRP